MGQVHFKTLEGVQVVELKAGQSVLKAAYDVGLDAHGYGECGGNCACATCHVYVQAGAKYLPKQSMAELELLDQLPEAQANSRLGCQLKISAKAVVHVALPTMEESVV